MCLLRYEEKITHSDFEKSGCTSPVLSRGHKETCLNRIRRYITVAELKKQDTLSENLVFVTAPNRSETECCKTVNRTRLDFVLFRGPGVF